MNPQELVRAPIKDGQLRSIIPDAHLDVTLTWQVGRILAPALMPLTSAVQKAAAKVLLSPVKAERHR